MRTKAKIGVLTFQYARNYGAQMQCYALQTYLRQLGYSVEVINYIPEQRKPTLPKSIVIWFRTLWNNSELRVTKKKLKKQIHEIKEFQSNFVCLTSSMTVQDLENTEFDYDAIIVGSDQIWNPSQHSKGIYFLNNFCNYKGLRISYAPCCASNVYSEENKESLSTSLNKFDSISVRNEETKQFIKAIIGKDVPIVCDPTFLVDYSDVLEKTELRVSGKYILTYVIGSPPKEGHNVFLTQLKKKYPDYKIISIVLNKIDKSLRNESDIVYSDLSPQEWLYLFKNAAFVYTDSFHGLAFSLIFRKQFLAYYVEKMRSSRFIDTASRLGLHDHILDSNMNTNIAVKEVDYASVGSKIDKMIEDSKRYIDRALSQINK